MYVWFAERCIERPGLVPRPELAQQTRVRHEDSLPHVAALPQSILGTGAELRADPIARTGSAIAQRVDTTDVLFQYRHEGILSKLQTIVHPLPI
jgi:hypothetical protein